MPKAQQDILTRSVTVEYTLWTIAGNFFAAAVATFFGYRKAFVALVAGAFVVFVMGYRQITDLASARLWFNLTGFFATGVFALYPLYIPPLFPTLLRTTGAGFCYNFGRLISAVGVLLGGALSAQVGGPAMAVWYVGFLYIFAFIVALTLPEPDSRPAQV
jgi:MFS family permease